MGNQHSYQDSKRKYTDVEVMERIQQLYKDNKLNQVSEASYGMPDKLLFTETAASPFQNLEIDQQIDANQQTGGGRFVSGRDRYNKYTLDSYIQTLKDGQTGGNPETISATSDNYHELSNFSEFERIREYMLQQASNNSNQTGGVVDNEDELQVSELFMNLNEPSPTTPAEQPFDYHILFGGLRSDSSEFENEDDLKIDSDDLFDGNVEDKSDYQDGGSPEMNFSETSDNLQNSDINILPFYSSESSSDFSFQHPYAKNRFD